MPATNTRVRLLASSMITSAAVLAVTSAYAQVGPQAAQAAAGGPATVGEVVVTGSRIPSPNLTSASPVTVVNSQEVKLQGTTNVETLLNSLPSVSPDFGLTSDNGTTGEATVDLRNLGSKRTLVLIDGKRLVPGDPINPVPDLDIIPAALIDRVDVLTGGASAVYGSDAVAGVVNFIMKKDFSGLRLDAQYGFFDYPNNNTGGVQSALKNGIFDNGVPLNGPTSPFLGGRTIDVTAIIGVNAPDGKGNITAYAGYRHVDPILQGNLDYSYCEIGATNGKLPFSSVGPYDTHYCAGSSNSAFGKFTPQSSFAPPHPRSGYANNPNGTNTFVPFGGQFDYNFAPYQYQLSQNERYSAGYFAHYDINDHAQIYSDFMFARTETVGQLGPSGLFQDTYNINCDNPLLTAGGIGPGSQANLICGANAGTPTIAQAAVGYRFANVSGAALPRSYDYVHTEYKIDIGLKGDIAKGWTYDAYAQYGLSEFNQLVTGQLSKTAIQNALLVDPATGQCTIGAPCVPLNVFNINGVTTAQANYLAAPGIDVGFTREQIVEADIVGDLGTYGIRSPWSKDGVGVAFGADYRGEHLGLTTDALTASGDISGSGGPTPPANGGYDVKELYTEIRVPLAQDLPFAHLLEVDAGYRFSNYTQAGSTNTYKVTGEWAPIEDVRFRGGFNRAVRAPNVVELFTPVHPNLFSGNDPCAGKSILPGNPLYAGCVASFANSVFTPAQAAALLAGGNIPQCAAGQCNELVGGNPNLKPEIADTWTGGVVLQPHWVRGLTFTVDYFNIKVSNVITSGYGGTSIASGAATELGQCVSTANPFYCNLVQRDPRSGSIAFNNGAVLAPNVNAGQLTTSGFDFDFNYRFHLSDFPWGHLSESLGTLTFNYVGTYTSDLSNTPLAGGPSFNCVGLYGAVCGLPQPYWRSKARLTWEPQEWPITVSLQWRHIGGVGLDVNHVNDPFFNTVLPPGVIDTVEGQLPAFNYFDLSGTWRIKDKITFRAGINNIFAKDPPVISTISPAASTLPFGNGNTYPNIYDSLGRQIFMGVTADF
ncbi:MAG TPA: TonB-dependent receptor [Caulobacteraceae bacterium]